MATRCCVSWSRFSETDCVRERRRSRPRPRQHPPITSAKPMLIVFSGLPGVGKTVIARELARQISAVYLRIDSMEQALRHASSTFEPLNDAGYRVAYAIAEDNLRLGRTVVADSVNPISITRDAWLDLAKRTGLPAAEIEIQCSDPNEHRRRIE